MRLVPFLIAAFLLINPLLELVFRKLEIQSEKLQFWVMLTTGIAWLSALVYLFLDPTSGTSPGPAEDLVLLPRAVFSLDWISGALILSGIGLLFVTVLTRQKNPQANAWLAGIGGACVIGLESNSAYTLGLTWTVIESFHFYFSYRDQQITSNPGKFLPAALLRLSSPAVLILLSLTQNEPGGSGLMVDLGPHSGPILIGTGLLGFLGWFLSFQGHAAERTDHFPGAVENWIPGMLGMLLILRGGALIEAGANQPWVPLILSCTLLVTAVVGALMDRTPGYWFLCCGLLAATSSIISGAESALSWGVVMMLPGTRLWVGSRQPRASLVPLILAAIGFLPLPFLPSWAGVSAFGAGIPGIILGLSFGILMGSFLNSMLRNWRSEVRDIEPFPLLGIIGAAAILISQGAIAFRLDWIDASRELMGKPITIWFSFLGLIPVLILGNYIPLRDRKSMRDAGIRLTGSFRRILLVIFRLLDRLVGLFSQIFEGQAGLIWALLIGLLLITIITSGGGSR